MTDNEINVMLRAYSNKVSYICGLQNNGKITAKKALKKINKLHKALRKYLKSMEYQKVEEILDEKQ